MICMLLDMRLVYAGRETFVVVVISHSLTIKRGSPSHSIVVDTLVPWWYREAFARPYNVTLCASFYRERGKAEDCESEDGNQGRGKLRGFMPERRRIAERGEMGSGCRQVKERWEAGGEKREERGLRGEV
eukprot:425457-Hanusia_phi.AAC.6